MQIEVLLPEKGCQIEHKTSDELKVWIREGKLKPTHQIRLKNLPWVEAQKIPAFNALFEAIKNKPQPQTDQSQNSHLANPLFIESLRTIINEKKELSGKPFSINIDDSDENKTEKIAVNDQPKNAEPSAAFKLFEKKALAKSNLLESSPSQNEPQPETAELAVETLQFAPVRRKKSVVVRKAAGYLIGCCFIFLLSLGGSYLWVYQLKSAVEIDEKSLPGLANLTYKLTSDKLELRLRTAEKEKELKNAEARQQPAGQIDVSSEIVKLENQYNLQRKNLLEEHRQKLQTADYNITFYFSLSVLLSLFLFGKVFFTRTSAPAVGKTSRAIEPETSTSDDLNASETVIEIENSEKSVLAETISPTEEQATDSAVIHSTESHEKTLAGETFVHEKTESVKYVQIGNCFLHQETQSNFVCRDCAKSFCAECVISFEQNENCCPFCRGVCTAVEAKPEKPTEKTSEQPEKKVKKANLLDSGKNKNFVVRFFPEKRTNKVGIIPAFVIAALFSSAIAILWVYNISPYLEKRETEVSQNNSPEKTEQPAKTEGTKTLPTTVGKNPEAANSQTDNPAYPEMDLNEPCIDPQTRQPFECDLETRKALYDHTRKVESVEKAQKETAEKTDTILSLILPSPSPATDGENPAPNQVDEARKKLEKQQLIKVFTYSFLIIFGLLMSTRLFGKDETPNDTETAD